MKGEKEKSVSNANRRLAPDSPSMSPLRQRKISESCLDTTSVGRVRTHSGCNPNISPFHAPFSPPISSYQLQPQLHNIPQENSSPTISDKRSENLQAEVTDTIQQSKICNE